MAASEYLKIENIGNSYMGTVYITPLYGAHAGEKIEAFEVQDLAIKCRKTMTTRRTLNNRTQQSRCVNKEYTISGTFFPCSSILQEIEQEYDDLGIQAKYSMDVTNNWEQDGLGKQRYKLEGVTFENYDVLTLNVQNDDVGISLDGRADKCKLMESATRPDVEWTGA